MLLMWGVISDSQSEGRFRLNISLQPLKGALKIRVWTRLSTGRRDGWKRQTDNSLNSALFFWKPPRYRRDRKIFISQQEQQEFLFLDLYWTAEHLHSLYFSLLNFSMGWWWLFMWLFSITFLCSGWYQCLSMQTHAQSRSIIKPKLSKSNLKESNADVMELLSKKEKKCIRWAMPLYLIVQTKQNIKTSSATQNFSLCWWSFVFVHARGHLHKLAVRGEGQHGRAALMFADVGKTKFATDETFLWN